MAIDLYSLYKTFIPLKLNSYRLQKYMCMYVLNASSKIALHDYQKKLKIDKSPDANLKR